MGELHVNMNITIDGVIQANGGPSEEDAGFAYAGWERPYGDAEYGAQVTADVQASDALLLGRRTYEGFKAAWPQMEAGTGDFGKKMNGMPKYVATTTLTEPEWNAQFLQGDVAEAVGKLKTEPGSLLINGSASLVNLLTRHNLIDEYRIMVYPVVVGEGRKLWDEGTKVALKLARSFTTTTGVEVITYLPA